MSNNVNLDSDCRIALVGGGKVFFLLNGNEFYFYISQRNENAFLMLWKSSQRQLMKT